MKRAIDMNCDMGESFGRYQLGHDDEVIKYVTSANIACGFHAGDPSVMRRTVRLAKANSVEVGAHPGFPDLLGFGRREMSVSPKEVTDYLTYQLGALGAFAKAEGINLQHVKPHGALYNMAVSNDEMARAIAASIIESNPNLILLVLARSRMFDVCRREGVRVANEAFADRAYMKDGTLAPRGMSGSVIEDPEVVAERVVLLARNGAVRTIEGDEIDLGEVHSICVHGDNPRAAEVASTIRQSLTSSGIDVVPLKRLL